MPETSLDSILNDKAPPPEPTPAEPAAEPAEPAVDDRHNRKRQHRAKELTAQGRDPETGQYIPKAEPEPAKVEPKAEPVAAAPAAPAQPEFTEREKAFLRTAEEERRKRQELERRYAQPQPPAPPTEPAKTFWDDPEGVFTKHRQEIQQVAAQTKLQTAEMIARTKYQDFDQEVAVFSEMAQTMPGLAQQCFASPDPAEFAYRTGKAHRELKEAGGLDQLRAKIQAEERAKVEAEWKAKKEAEAAELSRQRAALPPSLSEVRGGSQNRVAWTGPTPLDSILGK